LSTATCCGRKVREVKVVAREAHATQTNTWVCRVEERERERERERVLGAKTHVKVSKMLVVVESVAHNEVVRHLKANVYVCGQR
jgi:hypothetical protein